MKTSTQTGFTLIEMLVTVAVFAVLVTNGVPSLRGFVQNNALVNHHNDFITALNLARSEAAKRSGYVTLCASSDQATCNTNNWESGWLLFTDADRDAAVDNGTDVVLQSRGALTEVTLRSSSFDNDGRIQFNSRGSLGVAGNDSGSFVMCDDRGASDARSVVISAAGQIRLARDTDDDGIINVLSGAEASCPAS
ncbi:MAG: GspH/FimT family pseudopilin [Chromatiales bacterium]|nr:GspH/FimT family pseudopilin [Chromatiales bacterium]